MFNCEVDFNYTFINNTEMNVSNVKIKRIQFSFEKNYKIDYISC